MTSLNAFFLVVIAISGITVIGCVVWLLLKISKLNKSEKLQDKPSSDTPKQLDIQVGSKEYENLVDSIKHNSSKFSDEYITVESYSHYKSKEMKVSVLWYLFGQTLHGGSEIAFVKWLYEENKDLGSRQPIVLLDEEDNEEVYRLLGKTVYGSY